MEEAVNKHWIESDDDIDSEAVSVVSQAAYISAMIAP